MCIFPALISLDCLKMGQILNFYFRRCWTDIKPNYLFWKKICDQKYLGFWSDTKRINRTFPYHCIKVIERYLGDFSFFLSRNNQTSIDYPRIIELFIILKCMAVFTIFLDQYANALKIFLKDLNADIWLDFYSCYHLNFY